MSVCKDNILLEERVFSWREGDALDEYPDEGVEVWDEDSEAEARVRAAMDVLFCIG